MTEKDQQIAAIRKRIGEAEVEPAIEQLLNFLEKSPAYLDLHSDALQALAQYRKTKREEAQSLISYEQARQSYSQVINQVLNILEALQREETTGLPRRRRLPLIGLGVALLLLLAAGGYWLATAPQRKARQLAAFGPCPEFKPGAAYNILLLPFRYLRNPNTEIDDDTPLSLRERFSSFGLQYGISLDPVTLPPTSTVYKHPDRLPPDLATIDRIGRRCPVQLVVWGTSETAGGQNVLITRYKFFNLPDAGFHMTKLTLEGSKVDTVTFISNIVTTNTVTGKIEEIFKILQGLVAFQSGDNKAVLEQLEGIESSNDSLRFVRDVMLADAYLRTQQEEKAQTTYDRLTEEHPQYWVAWYNRGMLNLKQGNYEEAAADLSNRLTLDSTDASARLARGEAYLKLDQLKRAKDDLELARKAQPENTAIQQRLDQVQSAIEQQRFIREEAAEKLSRNPADRSALRQKLKADMMLGDAGSAVETARQWIEREPRNADAHQALFRAFLEAKRPDDALRMLNQAVERGILKPDPEAYKSLFKAFLDAGRSDDAQRLLDQAVRRGILKPADTTTLRQKLTRNISLTRSRTLPLRDSLRGQ